MLLYFFRSINLLSNRIPHLESRNLIRQDKYGNRIIILQFFVYFTFIFTKVSINMRVNIINFPSRDSIVNWREMASFVTRDCNLSDITQRLV